MKTFFQAVVFIFLALPFIYMLYDVVRELIRQSIRFLKNEGSPKLSSVLNLLIK